VLITPSLGVPNWSVIYINTAPSTSFSGAVAGECNTPTFVTMIKQGLVMQK
jgi:hypothetical protein